MFGMTHRGTRWLPGSCSAAGTRVFLVKSKRHDIVAVTGEEALPLVRDVHDDAHTGNVVYNLAIQGPEQVVVGIFVAEIKLSVVAVHPVSTIQQEHQCRRDTQQQRRTIPAEVTPQALSPSHGGQPGRGIGSGT